MMSYEERYWFYIRVGLSEYKYKFKGFLNGQTQYSFARQFHAIAMEAICLEIIVDMP